MPLIDELSDRLKEKQWLFLAKPDAHAITMNVWAEEQSYPVILLVRADTSVVIGLFLYNRRCAPESLAAMATFVNSANFLLVSGGFEIDSQSGVVRFRDSVDVEGVTLSADFVDAFVRRLAGLGAGYARAVAAVLNGTPVADAVSMVEALGM
jgi:hypothetical protein